jgi:hypothetical protein
LDRRIEVKIKGFLVDKDNRKAGVQHEGNVTELRLEFDSGWDMYAKTITFWDATMSNPVKVVLGVDRLEDYLTNTRVYIVPIPPEALGEAGDMTFVIDGFIDGKRKRSLSDTLYVEEAPFEPDAADPADPTPTQAEQLQKQIEFILDDVTAQANIAYDKAGWAEYYAGKAQGFYDGAVEVNERVQFGANQATQNAALALAQAILAQSWAAGGTNTRADEEENNAKFWSLRAQQIAGGDYATRTEAKGYANAAVTQAGMNAESTYVPLDGGKAMTGDMSINKLIPAIKLLVSGVLGAQLMKNSNGTTDFGTGLKDIASISGKAVDLIVRAADSTNPLKMARDGVEYNIYGTHNLTIDTLGGVNKAGGEMDGVLVFNNPTVFSAIAKKRKVGDKNYLLRLGLGSEGTGAAVSLRLIEVNASGSETVLCQFDLDTTGVYWTLGGSKKTIAHSGNIGALTATVG